MKDHILEASFAHLRSLHNREAASLLKLAPQLTYQAINPTNFERQRVRLALAIFHEKTLAALEHVHEDGWLGTYTFISTIWRWWSMVNVGSVMAGEYRSPELWCVEGDTL